MEKTDTTGIEGLQAAALPLALKDRLLSAIAQTTQDVEAELAEEKAFLSQLKQLSPSPLSNKLEAKILKSIASPDAARTQERKQSGKLAYTRWYSQRSNLALVACIILAALCLPLLKPQLKEALGLRDSAAAQGFISRNVIFKEPAGKLQWTDDQVAERSYDVLYQDAFVFHKDKNTSIIIQVPNQQRRTFEEEII